MIFIKNGKNELEEYQNLSVMTLATVGANGEPHAADVYFAADSNLNLFFFSDPESQHCQDVTLNPSAGATIHPECSAWREIRGLQLRGTVSAVTDPEEWERAWELYQTKFPFVAEFRSVIDQNQLYIFKPDWVRLVDNRKGFGCKLEWKLPKER